MMKTSAVIDSNVLIAFIDDRDKWHSLANQMFSALKVNQIDVIYFDCVINETISVLARRLVEQNRSNQFPELLDRLSKEVPVDAITWVSGEIRHLYPDILTLIRATNGTLNFHDALIALVCRELNTRSLVSFDQDFDSIDWLKRVTQPQDLSSV